MIWNACFYMDYGNVVAHATFVFIFDSHPRLESPSHVGRSLDSNKNVAQVWL